MEILANLFIGLGNWIIILSGFVLLILLFINTSKLSEKKNRIAEELSQKEITTTIDSEARVLNEEIKDRQVSGYNLDTIRNYKKSFNELCSVHTLVSQLIPVFPLMGVFGTVFGLMKQVQAQDVESMLSSLDVALTTTIWGLFFAILLKIIDSVFPARIINETEVLFEDFDTKIEITNLFQK